jgi:sugar/nucleoside kinase (ribokinase family)
MYSEDIGVILNYVQNLNMIVRSVDSKNKKELSFLKQLAQEHDKFVLASLGADGSVLFTKDNEYFEPASKINISDTTGAGDAYIVYFIVSYLQTKNIPTAMKEATKATEKVITHFGATI